MIKVITYGTYDLLHYGHIKLLQRAKELGDYLIVGITSDDYDKTRGKINNQQSLIERIASVKATGIADEIIVEEYEGQKIDDIRRYGIDIFTVGSDWTGYFDYLKEFCKVVYLPRTEGISSSEIREKQRSVQLGIVGESLFLNKVLRESKFVNGLHINTLCTQKKEIIDLSARSEIKFITDDYLQALQNIDAVYIRSHPQNHFEQIKLALISGKHVLCESPLTLSREESEEVVDIARSKGLVLMEAIKTAYATAYTRLLLLSKTQKIGDVVSVDATCTSIRPHLDGLRMEWDCIYEWGPTALLPVFQILGTNYKHHQIVSRFNKEDYANFTKIDFVYNNGVATIKIGDDIKSEGDLIISGTKGYLYVPSPWWLMDYFEIRFENQMENKRYFYQLDGEGIRYELVAFIRAIGYGKYNANIAPDVSFKISEIMNELKCKNNMMII